MTGRASDMSADAVAFTDRHIAIYVGRDAIGEVLVGRTIRAVDASGNEIGTFKSRDEAMTAIIAKAAKCAGAGQ